MPNPRRRHSKARGRWRRNFYKAKSANLSKCPQCGKPKRSHRICLYCGYYKDKSRVTIMTKDEKKKAREKKT